MGKLGNWKERLYTKLRRTLYLENIDRKLAQTFSLQIEEYLHRNLFNNPRYQQADKLNRFEFQAFSQFGEDGIIQEIFKRIGVTNRFFVEFGVEDGSETNTTYLLYQDWQGVWIDGSPDNTAAINHAFSKLVAKKKIKAITSFITAENIEQLFKQGDVPA